MTFYIKNTNNVAFYIKLHAAYKCKKYLKVVKFTQCTHRSLRANNLILLLNLNITVYIKDQYENTKYSRTLLHTKSSLYLSQVNCTVIEHTIRQCCSRR